MLVTHNNKVLINEFGQVLKKYEIPKIELTTRRPAFPYYNTPNYGNGRFRFTTTQINTIYIDWGDGSEIYEREFSGTLEFSTAYPVHTYTDGIVEHKISIWFKLPSKITVFSSTLVELHGEFPRAISLYNLNNLVVTGSLYLNEFPLDFGAGIFNYVQFHNVTSSNLNSIPLWITKSRISRLDLGGKIILSNPAINNVDEIINIKDLTSMNFTGLNSLSDVSPNFKDISTLRYLSIGGYNPTLSITANINACKQITHLGFGYTNHNSFGTTNSNGQINSWGFGLVGMSNLTALYLGDCRSAPVESIPGLEDAVNLKTLYLRSCYTTTTRMDSFISNLFSQVQVIASMVVGNTIMRNVRMELPWIVSSSAVARRPTGVYQEPSGYVQGTDNGAPSSPMEMLYVLVKQYRWTILIPNATENGIETLTP